MDSSGLGLFFALSPEAGGSTFGAAVLAIVAPADILSWIARIAHLPFGRIGFQRYVGTPARC